MGIIYTPHDEQKPGEMPGLHDFRLLELQSTYLLYSDARLKHVLPVTGHLEMSYTGFCLA
jgi:hypothetical protein